MKKILPVIIALLLGAGAATAAPGLGASGGHDLDALWAAAKGSHDLTQEDAVLLLESRRVAIGLEGTVATTVHRVVWIGTATGLRSHADLRVPWNSATCALAVTKLRTWREGRWWPDADKLSDTAIVHTLPYAVDHADDYTTMRETMLLHDGVELPCIMETEYTITERGLPGADDGFVMTQRDPAVLVQLTVETPATRSLHHFETNGAPAPASAERDGRRELTWTLQPAPALGLPITAEPAASEPTVVWSTWTDWNAVATAWEGTFREAAVAPKAAVDSLRSALREACGDRARLEAVGKWLEQSVRPIHQDDRWWTFAPRPAERTWQTAYGHTQDRAVLWASLLKDLDYAVSPVLADTPGAPAPADLPGLAGRGRLLLQVVTGDPGDGTLICDPADGSVHGAALLDGRPLLWLANGAKPEMRPAPEAVFSFEAALTPADSAWTGSGCLSGGGPLTISDEVAAAAGGLKDQIGRIATSVLDGAKVTDASATFLRADRVGARFALTVPFAKKDAGGATRLVVGRPQGGLLDRLPADVRLDDATRATPVLLAGPLRQSVTVRLSLKDRVTARLPEPRVVANAAGTFTISVEKSGGWLTCRRELALAPGAREAAAWPALRALLLEEADAANGILALRPAP